MSGPGSRLYSLGRTSRCNLQRHSVFQSRDQSRQQSSTSTLLRLAGQRGDLLACLRAVEVQSLRSTHDIAVDCEIGYQVAVRSGLSQLLQHLQRQSLMQLSNCHTCRYEPGQSL